MVEAHEEMDAGDIWDSREFLLLNKRKSSVYNKEVSDYGLDALLSSTENFFSGQFKPESLDYSNPKIKGRLRPAFKKS